MPKNSLATNPEEEEEEEEEEESPLQNSEEKSPLKDSKKISPLIKPNEQSLVDYQDALLELLSSGLSQEAVLETLKKDPRFANFQDYIKTFDPDMVAVACELMGKWAKRKS